MESEEAWECNAAIEQEPTTFPHHAGSNECVRSTVSPFVAVDWDGDLVFAFLAGDFRFTFVERDALRFFFLLVFLTSRDFGAVVASLPLATGALELSLPI